MSGAELYYLGYTPVGDVLVLGTVIIFALLLSFVYVRPKREIQVFKRLLGCISFAAMVNLLRYVFSVDYIGAPVFVMYALRSLYFLLLFGSLYFYIRYIEILLDLGEKNERRVSNIALILEVLFCFADVIASITHVGFYYDETLDIHKGNNLLFAIEYAILVGLVFYMIKKHGERIYKPLVTAFTCTSLVSVLIIVLQGINNQRSFTTSTFIYPAFAVLYILHSNPYDPELGALKVDSLGEIIQDAKRKDKKLIILGYYLHEFDLPGKSYPEEIRKGIRNYIIQYLKGASLIQITNGRMLLLADLAKNPDYEKTIDEMLKSFKEFYERYRQDYKIVVMQTRDELDSAREYIQYIEFIEERMSENEIYFIKDEDYGKFESHKYILSQLEDIHANCNLQDERVTVFCQPVFNVRTGRYDTAEALMRLTLEKTGMVFPDMFIPLAEKHNFIHGLSLIILAKTCKQIKEFIDKGLEFTRISVNFSILDFREPDFCESVEKIVKDAGIPFDKLAIEVTESQNENDFKAIKEKFAELRNVGITLYLDDFGTGYSSFERIIEIPFDIIKFDRSLVIASSKYVKAETTVSYLARMFTDLSYSVLYEGIEDASDEERCINMCARYLQGYKYSKAIPIERLSEFFEKKEYNPVAQ